ASFSVASMCASALLVCQYMSGFLSVTNDTACTVPSWMTARLRVGNGPGRCLIMAGSTVSLADDFATPAERCLRRASVATSQELLRRARAPCIPLLIFWMHHGVRKNCRLVNALNLTKVALLRCRQTSNTGV